VQGNRFPVEATPLEGGFTATVIPTGRPVMVNQGLVRRAT